MHTILSPNPHLLVPSRSIIVYVRKQNRSGRFEWQEKKQGWFWHVGEYHPSWERKVKVLNPFPSAPNKGSASMVAKTKFSKKGKGIAMSTLEVCFDIVPYVGDLPLIGSIILESTPPAIRTCSTMKSIVVKPKPSLLK